MTEPARNASEIYPHDRLLAKTILKALPYSIKPNHVTILRLMLTPFVVYVNYRQWYGVGIPLFLFAAATDAIDGALARTRNQITNFGKIADPLADKILIGSMVILLVFRYLPTWIGYAVVGIEIMFIISASFFHMRGIVRQANGWGKIKMILQVVAVFVVLLALTMQTPWLFAAAAWLFGAAIVFAIASLFSHGI